jgi:hypothetical protein
MNEFTVCWSQSRLIGLIIHPVKRHLSDKVQSYDAVWEGFLRDGQVLPGRQGVFVRLQGLSNRSPSPIQARHPTATSCEAVWQLPLQRWEPEDTVTPLWCHVTVFACLPALTGPDERVGVCAKCTLQESWFKIRVLSYEAYSLSLSHKHLRE